MAGLQLQTAGFSYSPLPPTHSSNCKYKYNSSAPFFHIHLCKVRGRRRVAVSAASAEPAKPDSAQAQTTTQSTPPKKKPAKPVYSLKKGQIVRVDKEKYLTSINIFHGHITFLLGDIKHLLSMIGTANSNCVKPGSRTISQLQHELGHVEPGDINADVIFWKYLSVGHPKYYKGLDYIYEDRGEVLDIRIFETGEYALIAWVGIPTAPAWLPTDMLIKSEKLNYERV